MTRQSDLTFPLPWPAAKKESIIEKQLKEEQKLLESVAEKRVLMAAAELAQGVEYTEPIKTR